MTRAEWDALSAMERDAIVCKALGIPGKTVWVATSDGGESAAAMTNPGGPWRTEHDLRHWLDRKHADGLLLNYEIGTWTWWPEVSTTPDGMMAVVEKMLADGWRLTLHVDDHMRYAGAMFERGDDNNPHPGAYEWAGAGSLGMTREEVMSHRTAPEAVCLAALTALGEMEP